MTRSVGRPLQPLRIPRGWTICHNQFFDVEPKLKTFDDVSWDFGEEIFQLMNVSAGVIIDLGWYPAHRSTGAFALVAVRLYEDDGRMSDSWSKPLRELRTRSRQKIVRTLEQWLEEYGAGGRRGASSGRRGASSGRRGASSGSTSRRVTRSARA